MHNFCCQGEAWLKKCPKLTYYNIFKDTTATIENEEVILGDENPMIDVFKTRKVKIFILKQIQDQTIHHNWVCEMNF